MANQLQKLQDIWTAFNDILGVMGDVYICGGAVRDSLRGVEPKDYDVYIINAKGSHWNDISNEIKKKLVNYPKVKAKFDWHKSEPFLVDTISYDGSEIQIMLRGDAHNVDELVDSFDWNVALFAYGINGVYKHKNAVDLADIDNGGELKLNKITYPYSTLRRGYRFSERFLMKLETSTVHKIMIAIDNHNANWHRFQRGGGEGI
jgi:hypothetical protein